MFQRSDPLNETLPLTRGLRSRQTLPAAGRSRRLLSTTGRRFIRYGVACLLFLAVEDLMVTLQRSLQTENLIRKGERTPEPTVMEDSADAETQDLPHEAFQGSTDEIVALAGKPSDYTARLFSGYLPLNNGGNAATTDKAHHINLKKFVVGNGVNEFLGLSSAMFAYYHGLVSTEQYQKYRASCPDLHEFEKSPIVAPGLGDASPECSSATLDIFTTLIYDRINAYDVYSSCAGSPKEDIQRLVKEILTPSTPGKLPHPIGNTMDLCLDTKHLESYFNLAEVRNAIHANPALAHWSSNALTTASMESLGSILGVDHPMLQHPQMLKYTPTLSAEVTPLWRKLLASGVKGVIYHGDADLICNAVGGLWAVESLGVPRLAPRSAWTYGEKDSKQTGGFVEAFEGISYLTVKGAGYLVPMTQPEEAKQMLDLFVLNDLEY
ncbi:hypothetical protein PF004_g14392 [Phytophthora fragariae]|uniref:Carboxypeptidase n=1 Tax=Phytophthora fragariae TaxID=53985 RepID=A0A6G0NPC2_9STRA|nr:hypothetical protein PF004_g14392 [Phytophthora fragariae]